MRYTVPFPRSCHIYNINIYPYRGLNFRGFRGSQPKHKTYVLELTSYFGMLGLKFTEPRK